MHRFTYRIPVRRGSCHVIRYAAGRGLSRRHQFALAVLVAHIARPEVSLRVVKVIQVWQGDLVTARLSAVDAEVGIVMGGCVLVQSLRQRHGLSFAAVAAGYKSSSGTGG